ncbi:MAG: hypothetical protein ABEK59_10520 [Halobacteria archaeon]
MNVPRVTKKVYSLSRVQVSVTIIGAVVFLALYIFGFYSGNEAERKTVFTALSVFNILAVFSSGGLLLFYYYVSRRKVTLLAGAAMVIWGLASLFWFSYIFLLNEVVAFPSLAQFGFKSYHVLMIPVLLHLIEKTNVDLYRPSFAVVAVLTIASPLISVLVDTSKVVGFYNMVYVFLTTTLGVLGLHLVYHKRLTLVGVGVLGTVAADLVYISMTFSDPTTFVVNLDPLWFSSFAVSSYGLILYLTEGQLE